MLPVENSNHYTASQNETPYYYIDNKVDNHEFLSWLDFVDKSRQITEKKPWTMITFFENNKDNRTAIWKIHVSATTFNYKEIFKIVTDYCIKNSINFKFISNYSLFKQVNGKTSNRVSAGKFIVVYPKKGEILSVLENLYKKTSKFEGPYILSDKQYKDSQVLYYRYGEYLPIRIRNEKGTIGTFIKDNNNQLVRDKRVPYYYLPNWIEDLPLKSNSNTKSNFLSKYTVLNAKHFSSSGGVYTVKDNYENSYIAKEARAFTGVDETGLFATDRLDREKNFLQILEPTAITPKVHDYISEYGNVYLIEEEIIGITLREFIYRLNPLLNLEKSTSLQEEYYEKAYLIFKQLLEKLQIIHQYKISLYDISDTNIIIENFETENPVVRIIDLENAIYENESQESYIETPGFRSAIKKYFKKDIDKIMLIGLAMFFPLNALYELDNSKKSLLVQWAKKNVNEIPKEYMDVLDNYYNVNQKSIPSILENRVYEYKEDSIIEFIDSILDSYNKNWQEHGYYFPADPHIFNTNPFSIAHGVFGVLYGLFSINLDLDLNYSKQLKQLTLGAFNDWKDDSVSNMPSGLLMGNAGVLLTLLKMNFTDEAKIIYKKIADQPDPKDNGLFYGKAGIIISLLYYWSKVKKKSVKDHAIRLADLLVKKNPSDDDLSGFYEGNAGIAVTLLVTYYHTNDKKYLSKAYDYMNWVLEKTYTNSRGNLTINRLPSSSGEHIESSFLYNGLSGIGIMLIMFFKVTGDNKYKVYLEKISESLEYKIQHFPGLMRGLSGITDFLITCYQNDISDKQHIKKIIEQQISGFKLHEINYNSPKGKGQKGFSGEQSLKISNDLYTGTTGIIGVISRWVGTINGDKIPSIDICIATINELLEGEGK